MGLNTSTADSGITFGGPTSTMPTKAELEWKIANLRRQLQTATEKEHESQETIIELRQLVTQQETTLEETLRERDDTLGQLEVRLSEMSSEIEFRV